MANRYWKAFERTDFFVRAKVGAKRFLGRELRLKPDMSLPCVEVTDWWFAPRQLAPSPVVYSLGVGRDTVFDEALICDYGAEVYAFDPTPTTREWIDETSLPERFNFYPWAIADHDGELTFYPRLSRDGEPSWDMMTLMPTAGSEAHGITVPARTLTSIIKQLGHQHVDLLKMDIEGAEYDVLEQLIESDVRPGQILVEFHHRFFDDGLARTSRVIDGLRRIGYGVLAVSINGREVAFVHKPAVRD
ncbi:MAG: FkbM family methyltransferase [Pseudomonadota bacterium]